MKKSLQALVAGCSILLSISSLPGQQDDPVFRVDVNLVHILATVRGPNGEPIGDLNKNDFSVINGEKEREIVVFERHTNRPLSVALMVDTSLSTGKERRFEKESAKRFAENLFETDKTGADRLAVFRFSVFVELVTRFTNSIKPISKALSSIAPDSGTSMYDAILLASDQLSRRPGRRVMVIVTDGGDTTSNTSFQKALERAQQVDAVIYGMIVVPIRADAGRNVGGENALKVLSARTGGETFIQYGDVEMHDAFARILRNLRTQYLIGYYPPERTGGAERFRTVDLKVGLPDATVLARKEYYVPKIRRRQRTNSKISLRPPPKGRVPPRPLKPSPPFEPRGIQDETRQGSNRRPPKGPRGKSQRGRPQTQAGRDSSRPEDTFEEARYLKHLTANQIPVSITTWEGDEFASCVEYYDRAFVRLTQDDAANIFVFKKDIKYLQEDTH